MSGALWAIATLGFLTSVVALAVGVASARRYRELRTALIATGVLTAPSMLSGNLPEESALPALDSPVPPDIRATSIDGTVIDSEYLATGELLVVFLMVTQCTACEAVLPDLRTTLEGLPAERPRPVVVLSGPSAEGNRYRKVLGPVAHVVDDGYIKSGQGVVRTFKVHSFPTMLALGDGVVRRAGTTLAELALERT